MVLPTLLHRVGLTSQVGLHDLVSLVLSSEHGLDKLQKGSAVQSAFQLLHEAGRKKASMDP